jgi:hypothetical protein
LCENASHPPLQFHEEGEYGLSIGSVTGCSHDQEGANALGTAAMVCSSTGSSILASCSDWDVSDGVFPYLQYKNNHFLAGSCTNNQTELV